MAINPFFKPFVHKRLGPLSLDRTRDSTDAVTIAAKEIESAFGDRDQHVVDVILSLGCCVEQHDTEMPEEMDEFLQGTYWRDLLEKEGIQHLGAPPTRFQFPQRQPPSFDDLGDIERIQKEARFLINSTKIRAVAARLFASLFYVETVSTARELSRNRFLINGKQAGTIRDFHHLACTSSSSLSTIRRQQ
jgi:hypothetical protein